MGRAGGVGGGRQIWRSARSRCSTCRRRDEEGPTTRERTGEGAGVATGDGACGEQLVSAQASTSKTELERTDHERVDLADQGHAVWRRFGRARDGGSAGPRVDRALLHGRLAARRAALVVSFSSRIFRRGCGRLGDDLCDELVSACNLLPDHEEGEGEQRTFLTGSADAFSDLVTLCMSGGAGRCSGESCSRGGFLAAVESGARARF